MRCFIAIELDEETRNILAKVQEKLKGKDVKGKYTRIDNLHLTLKFLGEIDESAYFAICNLIKKVSVNHKLFVLKLDRLGKFDKGSKKIVWAGLSYNKNLVSLYNDIESGLEKIMTIKKENYYTPHITLIREATLSSNKIDDEIYDSIRHSFRVNGISLMESTRVEGKLTYVRRAYESFMV